MNVLILSCGTGGGHNAAASAIQEELRRRGHSTTTLNPYVLKSEALAQRIDDSYVEMVQKVPSLFGAVYDAGQLYRKLSCRSPVYHANRHMVPVMEQYLSAHHYDAVITTHLYPAEILTNMKHHGIEIPKTIFIATDYVCIPFTEETDCDAYIIPAKDLASDFVRRGLPAEKLYPLGIPTDRVFTEKRSKAEARMRLNLDLNKTTILITGGSMGGGKIRDAINALVSAVSCRPDMELIIVCGKNEALYSELTSLKPDHTLVIGYTEEMACLMQAADLFITKPGGLSSTEAAVCGVPILHTAAIPGCELYNAEYFSSHNMSALCRNPEEVFACAMELLAHPQACARMVECQHTLLDGSAAARICTFVEELASERKSS